MIENLKEKGEWKDMYSPDQENKEWRWPSAQAALDSQRAKSLADQQAAQRFNDMICSKANSLCDEAEECWEKVDSHLVSSARPEP